jgi:sporulation protein YlmC with PRC-barrel domain
MSTLLKASELVKKPVVTFAGEAVAQLKDVIYAADGGQIGAFTLAGRGLFSGPTKTALPWSAVIGLGPDAVIIRSEQDLVPVGEALSAAAGTGRGRADVMNSEVLTDDGSSLGRVSDVIIALAADLSQQADVVGYEIDPAESLGRGKQRLLIPLPDTLAASGEHLMVPAVARDYLTDNLAGFGAAVDAFRLQMGGVG